jgi:hypothetical protein
MLVIGLSIYPVVNWRSKKMDLERNQVRFLDWLADLIFGKRIEFYDPETDQSIHKIRIRRRTLNDNDPYGLDG